MTSTTDFTLGMLFSIAETCDGITYHTKVMMEIVNDLYGIHHFMVDYVEILSPRQFSWVSLIALILSLNVRSYSTLDIYAKYRYGSAESIHCGKLSLESDLLIRENPIILKII